MTQNNTTIDNVDNQIDDQKEFTDTHVPKNQRRGFFSLLFVWIGYVFTVTIMTAGGNLGMGAANFDQAMLALAVGILFLVAIGSTMSVMSAQTGLTFGLLSKYSFGDKGSKVISLIVTTTLLGWFSINCYLIGSVTNILFPSIPSWPVTIIAGFMMTFTALKGVDIMNKIGTVATIAIVIIAGLSLYLSFQDIGGLENLRVITNSDPLPFNALVSIVIGSLISGVISWSPDIMRYSVKKSTAISVMIVSVGFAAALMLFIGFVGMMVYGESDIAYILKMQGFLFIAWFALVANVWSTAQGNVYSSSLNLVSIFPQLPRTKHVILFGGAGTLIGLLGLYEYFGSWLSFLASIFPAIGGVVIADYFTTYRRGKGYYNINKMKIPNYILPSFISIAIGITTYYLVPFGLTAFNSMFATLVAQTLMSKFFIKEQITELNNHLEPMDPIV